MAFSERLHSADADLPRGGTLAEALALACPQAVDVLRIIDDDDPLAALRASGFRVIEWQASGPEALRFVHSAVAQRGDRWVALTGTRGRMILRDGRHSLTVTPAEAMPLIGGTIIEVEAPLENDSIAATILRGAVRERGAIASAVTATLIGPLIALAPAAAFLYVFNQVIPNAMRTSLTLVIAALAATALFQAWVSMVRLETLLYVRARLEIGVGRRLLAKVLRLPFSFLQKFTVSGLIEVFQGLGSARDLVSDRLLGAGFDGLISLSIVIVIAFVSPAAAVALLGSAIVYLAVAALLAYRQMAVERMELRTRIATRERLIDAVRAIAIVKAAAAEASMVERWTSRLRMEMLATQKRQRLVLYTTAIRDGVRQLTIFAVLILGAFLMKGGAARFGSYVALLQLTGTYAGGVLSLGALLQSILMAAPHVQQANEVCRVAAVPRVRRSSAPGRIDIDGLWFRYGEEAPWVLRDFQAAIEAGGVYRIEGPSGSGKTTLMRLLATIYTPTRGRIHVNGVDLHRGGSPFLYLPQDVQLFEGTLLDNLRLLSGGAAHDRLLTAADETGLAAWVAALPMGYSTLLMSGAGISGGQKQLIALTAAAAAGVPILLLDEAGSNLDAATYRRVFASPIWAGRTIVYVAHAAYAHLPDSHVLSVATARSSS